MSLLVLGVVAGRGKTFDVEAVLALLAHYHSRNHSEGGEIIIYRGRRGDMSLVARSIKITKKC